MGSGITWMIWLPHVHMQSRTTIQSRGRCCGAAAGAFAYLNVIGLIGGYAANEFIFFSPQSHTPEVKNDQIIPLRCCVWLLYMSHQGNQQMKSLKDGYFNSQELSASLASSLFLKPCSSTVGILMKPLIRFLFKKVQLAQDTVTRERMFAAALSQQNQVIRDSFNRFYVIVDSVGNREGWVLHTSRSTQLPVSCSELSRHALLLLRCIAP